MYMYMYTRLLHYFKRYHPTAVIAQGYVALSQGVCYKWLAYGYVQKNECMCMQPLLEEVHVHCTMYMWLLLDLTLSAQADVYWVTYI